MRRFIGPVVLSIVAMFVLISCGGGGGGGTREGLSGQYELTGIRFEYSNGLVVTEEALTPWDGFADIGHTEMYIDFTILGETTQASGPYTEVWYTNTSGYISDGYDAIDFTLSSGKLTLIFPDMYIDVGLTADAYLIYQKVSNSHISLSPERESTVAKDVNIAESIRQLMKSLVK